VRDRRPLALLPPWPSRSPAALRPAPARADGRGPQGGQAGRPG